MAILPESHRCQGAPLRIAQQNRYTAVGQNGGRGTRNIIKPVGRSDRLEHRNELSLARFEPHRRVQHHAAVRHTAAKQPRRNQDAYEVAGVRPIKIEGGFTGCDAREARVNRILGAYAVILQLRHVARRQIEIKIRVGLGCLGELIRRRRIGRGNSGLSFHRLHDFVCGCRSKVLVSRIVFARTVNLGRNTGLSPNISVSHTVPISFSKFLKAVNHDLLHLLLAEKLAAGSAPAKSEVTGEVRTWIHYSATQVESVFLSSMSCSVWISLDARPIHRFGRIAFAQSANEGMNPRSSRTCCSPIHLVGMMRPVESVIVVPKMTSIMKMPSA